MVQQGGRRDEEGLPPYGFVNMMMSDAPSVQRITCEHRYVRAGNIPHVRGSSSLKQSYRQPHIGNIHVGRWALAACKTAAMYGARQELVTDLKSRM